MYFPFLELHGWGKRFAVRPQTIYSEVPKPFPAVNSGAWQLFVSFPGLRCKPFPLMTRIPKTKKRMDSSFPYAFINDCVVRNAGLHARAFSAQHFRQQMQFGKAVPFQAADSYFLPAQGPQALVVFPLVRIRLYPEGAFPYFHNLITGIIMIGGKV